MRRMPVSRSSAASPHSHSCPLVSAAQAVYGSIGGTVNDPTGAVLPGVTVTIISLTRKTTDSVVTNESGLFVKERLLPGEYSVQAELAGFKTAVVPQRRRRRRRADAGGVRARRSAQLTEQVTVTGGSTLLTTDRADVATRFDSQADHRSAGARSQLHQVHPADARHAAAAVAARGQREPAGLDADDGERPAFQRHRLSARRHREPRSDPRHHRHQPDARVDRRDEDHVAELRRGVRPGDRRRRLGADAIRAPTRCTAAPSSSSRTTRSRRATRSRSSSAIR